MVTENKNDTMYVVLVLLAIALMILGSLFVEFEVMDVIYLIFIIYCLLRFCKIKRKR